MRRYLSLYFPAFAVRHTRLQHNIDQDLAIALMANIKNCSRVVLCSKEAKKSGIRAGMTVELASALCSELQVYKHAPLQDFKLLYKIAIKLLDLSPFVAIDSELILAYKKNCLSLIAEQYTGIIIDITGTERLYRSEKNLLHKIFSIFDALKFETSAGIASTIGTAWALARYGHYAGSSVKYLSHNSHRAFIDRSQQFESLQKLPVTALRINKETITKLAELGLYNIKSLKNYSHKELALRFGSKLANRIDQAFGKAEETLFLLHPKEYITSDHEYDPALNNKTIVEQALLSGLKEVLEKLKKNNKKAANFDLTIQGFNPQKTISKAAFCIRKNFTLRASSKDLKHLEAIIMPFFANLEIPEGVTRLTLAAKTTHSLHAEQYNCVTEQERIVSKLKQDELINILSTQLGNSNVRIINLNESFIPEKSYSFVPLEHSKEVSSKAHGFYFYPPTIFTYPEKITAISLLPDAPPTRITLAGKLYKILKAQGPERITDEWWQNSFKSHPEEREYFRVQDETGRWLWIYRTRSNLQWYLHGVWH